MDPPKLAVTPGVRDFGRVGTGGSSAAQSFAVTNVGDTPTGDLALVLAGDAFKVAADGCSSNALAPGASCTVQVAFVPDAAGPAIGTVRVAASPGGSVEASLTGVGLAPGRLTEARPACRSLASVGEALR